MEPEKPESSHATDFVIGLVALGLRIAAIFSVIGGGYYIYLWFGPGWFRVFVFATMAVCLDLELRRIDREFPPENDNGR